MLAVPFCLAASAAWPLTITSFDPNTDNVGELTAAIQAANSGIAILSSSLIGVAGQTGTYTGFNLSSTTGQPAIVAPNGALLTNGTVEIPFSNTSGSYSTVTGSGPNQQLSTLSASAGGTSVTFDQAALSLTFTVNNPTNNAVSAQFVYGSDEYPSQSVTDIFGFFVDGKNYAFFPNGSLVKFDTSTASSFNDNSDGNYAIEYNGISNLLTVNGLLDPSKTIHTLTIAIADTSDDVYDSGAFIGNLYSTNIGGSGGILTSPTINTTDGDISPNVFSLGSPAAEANIVRFDGGTLRMTGGDFPNNVISAPVTIDTANGTVDTSTGNGGFSGVVSGPGSLTVIGTATFSLTNANTYSGGTVLSGGTLQVSAGSQESGSSSIGSGTLTFNGGTLQVAQGGFITLANTVTISAPGGTIDLNDSGLILSGNIGGTGGLVVKSTGGTYNGNDYDAKSLALTGANTYSGGTSVQFGASVQVKADDALGSGSLNIAEGGIVDLAGFNQSVTALTGAGKIAGTGDRTGMTNSVTIEALTVQSGNFTGQIDSGDFFVSNGGSTQTIDYGDVNLVKVSDGSASGGTLTLTGKNTYGKRGGQTLLQAGIIAIGNDSALGTSELVMSDGTTLQSLVGLQVSNNIVLHGTDTIQTSDDGSAVYPYSGGLVLHGVVSGTGTLVKTGTTGLRLANGNTYSGGTIIEGGHIGVADDLALGTGTLTFAGGFLVAGAADITTSNTAILAQDGTIDSQTYRYTYAGTISGTGGLTKIGTGTLLLPGANTYSGGTILSGGTTVASNSTLDGSGGVVSSSVGTGTLTFNGGTLQFGPPGNIVNLGNAIEVDAIGGTLDSNGSYPRLSGAISDGSKPGVLTFTNSLGRAGRNIDFILSGPNTSTGGIVVNGSTDVAIAANNAGGQGSATVNGVFDLGSHNQAFTTLSGTGSVNATGLFGTSTTTAVTLTVQSGTFAGELFQGTSDYPDSTGTVIHTSGVLGLAKVSDGSASGGTLVLSGDTNASSIYAYSGPTTVSAGTLEAGSTSAFSEKSAVTVAAGATLDLGGFSNSVASLAGSGQVTNSGSVAAELTNGGDDTSTTFSGTVSDGVAPLSLTKTGTGTLSLTGSNSYSGGTVLAEGTLGIGSGSALGTGPLSMASDTTLDLLASFTLPNAIVFTGMADPTIDTGANNDTLSGVISGPDALTKLGSGTLDLTALNIYTGPTTVAQGTLLVDGSIANSATTVESGASLGGHGQIGGLTVNSGGTLAPGTGTPFSTLNVGNITFLPGSTFRVQVNAAGQTDSIHATGTATLGDGTPNSGGTVDVVAGGGTYLPSTSYKILTATGGVTGQFTNLTTTSNLAFLLPTLTYSGNSVAVGFTKKMVPVPVSGGPGAPAGPVKPPVVVPAAPTIPPATPGTPTTPPVVATPAVPTTPPVVATPAVPVAPVAPPVMVPVPFQSVAATPNQQSVAVVTQGLGAGNPVYGTVLSQSAAGAQQAFTVLSGEAHASTPTQAVAGFRLTTGIIFDRLWNVSGSGGSDAVSVLDQFGSTTLPALVRCYTPVTEPGKETPATYSVWGQGIGAFGRTLGDGNASTVKTTLGGFAFGADTRIDAKGLENWRIGIAGGYTNTAFDQKASDSAGTFENIFGTLYGGARYGAVDLRLGATYGGTSTNLRRTVAFPGFNEAERSSNDGSTVQGFGEVGYRLAFGETVVEPVFGGSFTHVHQDGFGEKGGAAALVGFAEDTDVGSTTAGLRGEAVLIAGVPLVARLFLGWQHAYGDINPASTLAFASGSARFETYGTPLDRNSAVAETALDYRVTAALSLGLAYTGQAGRHDRDNAVKGRMEYRF